MAEWTDAELDAAWEASQGGGNTWSDAELDAAWESAQPETSEASPWEPAGDGRIKRNVILDESPSFGQAAQQAGKNILTGVGKLAGLAYDYNPMAIDRVSRRQLLSDEAAEKLRMGPKILGAINEAIPETVGGDVADVVKSAQEASVFPVGGPVANALSGVGAEVAHKMAPESEMAPLLGSLFGGGAATAGGKLTQALANKMTRSASGLARKSIGARQSDYAKTAKDIGIIDSVEGVETTTKAALDDLLANNKLGSSRDPQDLLKTAKTAELGLSKEIGALIYNADKALGQPVVPTWSKALGMLEGGQIPGDKVAAYTKRLESIDDAIQSRGGRLPFIQQQKISLGKQWDPNDGVLNEFNRALYSDLQNAIEDVVPSVAPLNRELSKFKIVKPILQRNLSGEESADAMNNIIAGIRTSGGWGVPILTGAYTGGPLGAAAGAGLVYGLKKLASPQGKQLTANVFKATSPVIKKTGELVGGSGVGGVVNAMTKTNKTQERPEKEPESKEGDGSETNKAPLPIFYPEEKTKSSIFNTKKSNGLEVFGGGEVKTSDKGIDFIKKHEGLRLTSYKDVGGKPTVGYGHTGSGVGKGKISKAEAEKLLRKNVTDAESAVNELVKVPLEQNQFDALVSFVFNLGASRFKGSTLLKKLNAGDYEGAAEEFKRWNKVKGETVRGLTARRKAEANLFA